MTMSENNKAIYAALSVVCPGTYVAWPIGGAPPLPWFTYKREHDGEVFADNRNYGLMPRYRVELLFKENDPSLIDDFEAALSSISTWKLYESDMLDSENCLYHDYRLTLLPNREDEE